MNEKSQRGLMFVHCNPFKDLINVFPKRYARAYTNHQSIHILLGTVVNKNLKGEFIHGLQMWERS